MWRSPFLWVSNGRMIFLGQYLETLLSPWRAGHPAEDGGGSRELVEGRDALGHRPHGAGILPWMLQPWLGAPWGQPLLLQTLPCLSCLGPQHSGNLRQGCVRQPGISVKAVAGNNNKKLGYRSPSCRHCWPPTGRVLQGL